MAEVITKEKLENASLDADSLEIFISGTDIEDVLTRLGKQYPTLPKLVRILMETGGWKAYQTEAALLATTPTVNPSVGYAFDTKKMYLWNGTTWINEGLSQLDQAKDFTLSQFTTDNPNLYKKENNFSGLYVSTSNSIASNPTTALNRMPVEAGATYAIKSSTFNTTTFFVVLRDSDSVAVGSTLGRVTFNDTPDSTVKTFTIPADSSAKFALFSVLLPQFSFDIRDTCIVNKGNSISTVETVIKISGHDIADTFSRATFLPKAAISESVQLYDPSKNVNNLFVRATSGVVESSASATVMGQFPVNGGGTYAVRSSNFNTGAFAIALRATNSVAAGSTLGKVVLNDTNDPQVKTFTIPPESTAKFALINIKLPTISFDISASLSIMAGTGIVDYDAITAINGKGIADVYAREQIKSLVPEFSASILKNKKWLVVGDSITDQTGRANHNYHYYLAQMVGGMTIYNYGLSGTGFFNRSDVASKITQTDVDFISIFLGTNDWGNQIASNQKQLGVFGDTGTTTISGCINTTITGLIDIFPLIPLVIFTPLPRGNNWGLNGADNAYGYNLKDLVDLLHQYATHYSLPILDLYAASTLYPWNATANEYYFKPPEGSTYPPVGDGLHPNDEGHKALACRMRVFLESVQHKY